VETPAARLAVCLPRARAVADAGAPEAYVVHAAGDAPARSLYLFLPFAGSETVHGAAAVSSDVLPWTEESPLCARLCETGEGAAKRHVAVPALPV
jgi:hypothetical protein